MNEHASLSKKIEDRLEFFQWAVSGTTFLQGLRLDVANHGGWGAQGDIPPIMAFACSIAQSVTYARWGLTGQGGFPNGMKSVFSDWWKAQSTHPAQDVEKIVALSCARALMSINKVKEGDSTWKIAQSISKSMSAAQRIEAMKEAFRVANIHPGTDNKRPSMVTRLMALGHWRPEAHHETPAQGWQMLSECIREVKSGGAAPELHRLILDLGPPDQEFYRQLPVDCASVELLIRTTRGLLSERQTDQNKRLDLARIMLSDLDEWVRLNNPEGQVSPAILEKWSKIKGNPVFAHLESMAQTIVLNCNLNSSPSPSRSGPRF